MTARRNKGVSIDKAMEIFDESLGERGPVPFAAIDNPLVETMAELIGVMHRVMQKQYDLGAEQIRELVREEIEHESQYGVSRSLGGKS